MSQAGSMDVLEEIESFYRDYYRDELAQLVQSEERTLEVDYQTLRRARPNIAEDYLKKPDQFQEYFNEALEMHDFPVPDELTTYHVRIVNVHDTAQEYVRDVGQYSPKDVAGSFVSLRGQVSKRSQKTVDLKKAVFECQRCGTRMTIPQPDDDLQEPHECQQCERQGPFRLDMDSSQEHGVDHQLIRMQVMPEKAKDTGDATIDVHLEEDLVSSVTPGDRVAVNSSVSLRPESSSGNTKSTKMELYGDAKSIDKLDSDFQDIDIQQHMDRIEEIAENEPLEQISQSIAPKHYGDDEIKRALALQLVGAPNLEMPDGSKARGNIHLFLIGDPGVGKSKFLRRVKEIAPRSVFTTGAGSTKAGLTCAAVKDDFGDGGFTIEAGALVKAHQGVCCIDELDDMHEEDRAGLLEAMASSEINVSKAGMNPTLPADTTVLAAANPIQGRFDTFSPMGPQLDVHDALITRFDLIFTMTDKPDMERDGKVAEHVNRAMQVGQQNERGEKIEGAEEILPQIEDDVLRAYIAHAKEQVPKITDEAKSRINQEYVKIRQANNDGSEGEAPVPVTARKVEAMNRLAAAHARIRLGDRILVEDVEAAIDLVWSCLEDVGVDPESGKLDADIVETGQSTTQRKRYKAVLNIIRSEESEHRSGVPKDVIYEFAADMDISQSKVDNALQHWREKGEIYEPQTDQYFAA